MVRNDIARQKVARANAWLSDAEMLLSASTPTVRDLDLASFYLFLSIQECIDLAAHWIAEEGWPPADEAGATFDILATYNHITPQHATELRAATGLRNRIAHGYARVDHGRMMKEYPSGVSALREFLVVVADRAER